VPKKGKPHNRPKFKTDMTTQLVRAVDEYDIDDIEPLVRGGADINARNEEGLTLLQMAVRDRMEDIAEILLRLGADVNLKAHQNGYTALHYAADKGDEDLVSLLLTHKADPNITDRRKQSPLHIAADGGEEDIVKKLVAAGADVLLEDNLKRTAGRTADIQAQQTFHFAAEAYHNITEFLKEKETVKRKQLAEEALKKAREEKVKHDLDALRHEAEQHRFNLKPPKPPKPPGM
jgi:ankyrin repeat protein